MNPYASSDPSPNTQKLDKDASHYERHPATCHPNIHEFILHTATIKIHNMKLRKPLKTISKILISRRKEVRYFGRKIFFSTLINLIISQMNRTCFYTVKMKVLRLNS